MYENVGYNQQQYFKCVWIWVIHGLNTPIQGHFLEHKMIHDPLDCEGV